MTEQRDDAYIADLATQAAAQLARYTYRQWVLSVAVAEPPHLAALKYVIEAPDEDVKVSFLVHAREAEEYLRGPMLLQLRLAYVLRHMEAELSRRRLLFDGQPIPGPTTT